MREFARQHPGAGRVVQVGAGYVVVDQELGLQVSRIFRVGDRDAVRFGPAAVIADHRASYSRHDVEGVESLTFDLLAAPRGTG